MKHINSMRITSLALSLLLVFTSCFVGISKEAKAADGVTFTVVTSQPQLERGDTFTATVSMSGNTEGEGLTYDLIFDADKLEFISAEQGSIFSSGIGEVAKRDDSTVRAVALRNKETIPDGTVMTVKFKVKDTANGNVRFNSDITLLNFDLEPVETISVLPETLGIHVPATGIDLDYETLNLAKGGTQSLTAALTPSDTTDTVTWKSDNETVATVTSEGLITAVGGGTANITASIGEMSATCVVNVSVPMTGISIQEISSEIRRGESAALSVNYNPADTTDSRDVVWSVSDPSVLEVSENGLVTGLKAGTADVIVTSEVENPDTGRPYSDTFSMTVVENHLDETLGNKIVFEALDEPLLKGQSVDLTRLWNLNDIRLENNITDDISVAWVSDAEDVLTVDQNGNAYGVKEGKATITATISAVAGDGSELLYPVSIEIEVREIPLESIAFDQLIKEMYVGETISLNIIYNPANTTDIRDAVWTSSDDSVISVENGVLKALKEGKATITATVGDKTATCEINVSEKEGEDTETSTVTKTDQNQKDAVQTGDMANITWTLLLLTGSMILVILVMKKKNLLR